MSSDEDPVQPTNKYVYVYIHICLCVYIYMCVCVCVCVYIYIYIYVKGRVPLHQQFLYICGSTSADLTNYEAYSIAVFTTEKNLC